MPAVPYTYVLITPARNEEAFIEQTIQSVIAQTVQPSRWVIVSDGSTDGTDEIVSRYAVDNKWIELVKLPGRRERHFAGKVQAFNAGYERVRDLKFDVIGSVDADISFAEGYIAFLLNKFADDPGLGVAGTPFIEGNAETYNYRFTGIEHVSGACQLFRRECFQSIGGYTPVKEGGIDLIAVVSARMKGWRSRTFTEMSCQHHRRMGAGMYSRLKSPFKGGYHDYLMGVHPLWQFVRSIYQLGRKPYFIWGSLLYAGYVWALFTRAPRPVSPAFVAFRREEQMRRLSAFFRDVVTLRIIG